jgi:hypothetical protein
MTCPPPLLSLLPPADTDSTTRDSKYQWVQSRTQKASSDNTKLSEIRELSNSQFGIVEFPEIFFCMHLANSKWSWKRRVAYIHVEEPSDLGSL